MSFELLATPGQWILGVVLVLASAGVLAMKKPVHACLCFMVVLLCLAGLYLELYAEFIATMQILVYAGAILVLFMFVIVLFQDAHEQIHSFNPQSSRWLLTLGGVAFVLSIPFVWIRLLANLLTDNALPEGYGSVRHIGKLLYFDFFFPFEAVILIFLLAMVGALYIAKREKFR